jgi:NADPH:quinone reductase-like Zn-dependent oxidoreductase
MTLPTSMRAIYIPSFTSSISTLRPSTIPLNHDPETTILVKVTYVSPTHVDILYAQGKHQNNRTIAKPPFTLGTDFAGIIVSVPPSHSDFRVGERVYGSYFGAFAEDVAVNPGLRSIRRVPRDWSSAEACAVGSSGAVSLGALLRAGPIKQGEWVLVTGASGGLGVIACQIARTLGTRVIALVGNDEKAKVLRSVGVEACVKYTQPDWEQEVLKISTGGVTVVYDAVGLVEQGLRCCKFGGSLVVVGFAGRGGDMERLKVNRILLKGAGVLGYVSYSRIWHNHTHLQ